MAPVIHYEYDFSPYGQKTKLILKAAGVQFTKCDQPIVLPRPDLESLDITYRRIPLLAVGKDVYADSSAVISVIVNSLGKLPTSPEDTAYQVWGDNCFAEILALMDASGLSPEFIKDRETIFPFLNRPDISTVRPSGLAQFISRLTELEGFLSKSGGPFIHGSEISLADCHVIWPVRWAFYNLGVKDKGTQKADFPKVWALIEALPKVEVDSVSGEEAKKTILGSDYSAKNSTTIAKDDPLGIPAGTKVGVESFDSTPGSHPQVGKLVGTSINEFVVELDNGVRVHFPRIGYLVRTAENSPSKL